MQIPSRSPHGGLYCIHGTFPDHCQICVCDYVGGLEQQLRDERARVKVLREALEHITEYWNRDQNETAMADALWEIMEAAEGALAATAPEDES